MHQVPPFKRSVSRTQVMTCGKPPRNEMHQPSCSKSRTPRSGSGAISASHSLAQLQGKNNKGRVSMCGGRSWWTKTASFQNQHVRAKTRARKKSKVGSTSSCLSNSASCHAVSPQISMHIFGTHEINDRHFYKARLSWHEGTFLHILRAIYIKVVSVPGHHFIFLVVE